MKYILIALVVVGIAFFIFQAGQKDLSMIEIKCQNSQGKGVLKKEIKLIGLQEFEANLSIQSFDLNESVNYKSIKVDNHYQIIIDLFTKTDLESKSFIIEFGGKAFQLKNGEDLKFEDLLVSTKKTSIRKGESTLIYDVTSKATGLQTQSIKIEIP